MKNSSLSSLISDVTIIEKNLNPTSNGAVFKSVNLQEFMTSNFSFQNGKSVLGHRSAGRESDDEWHTNIHSGELTITEVVKSIQQELFEKNLENMMSKTGNLGDFMPKNLGIFESSKNFLKNQVLNESVYEISNKRFFEYLYSSNRISLENQVSKNTNLGQKNCCVGDCYGFCRDICTGGELRQCAVCEYKTQHLGLLRTHMRHHTSEKRYACDRCEYSTRKSYSLKAHKRTHTGEKPFICDQCPFACNDGSTLKRHKYTHSGHKPFSCGKCDYKCTRNSHLQRHIRVHLIEQKFECNKCEFTCDLKNILSAHKQEHSSKKLVTCPSCGYVTNDKSSMRRHKLIHSEEKPHSCDRCDYKCRRRSHLRRHLQTHERKDILKLQEEGEVNPLICEECGYFAGHAIDLLQHNCCLTENSLFYCNRCDFKTDSMDDLKIHKSVHVKSTFCCSQCPFESPCFSTLKRHILSHSKNKKYLCHECSYSSDHFSSMRKHKLNHSGNFQYKCDVCSYSSKRELNLDRHKDIHKSCENPLESDAKNNNILISRGSNEMMKVMEDREANFHTTIQKAKNSSNTTSVEEKNHCYSETSIENSDDILNLKKIILAHNKGALNRSSKVAIEMQSNDVERALAEKNAEIKSKNPDTAHSKIADFTQHKGYSKLFNVENLQSNMAKSDQEFSFNIQIKPENVDVSVDDAHDAESYINCYEISKYKVRSIACNNTSLNSSNERPVKKIKLKKEDQIGKYMFNELLEHCPLEKFNKRELASATYDNDLISSDEIFLQNNNNVSHQAN